MKSKRKLNKLAIASGIIIAVLIVSCIAVSVLKVDYTDKLIRLLEDNAEIKVNDVFRFDFDRAYVFDDCYISGTGFASAHDLDISIDQVESMPSEQYRRIVFVDAEGDFVYDFQYQIGELNVFGEEMVIYPETVIEKCDPVIPDAVTVKFVSSDYY